MLQDFERLCFVSIIEGIFCAAAAGIWRSGPDFLVPDLNRSGPELPEPERKKWLNDALW